MKIGFPDYFFTVRAHSLLASQLARHSSQEKAQPMTADVETRHNVISIQYGRAGEMCILVFD